jgi:hypothetical protein
VRLWLPLVPTCFVSALFASVLVVACGARTGLEVGPPLGSEADAAAETGTYEGGPLDVQVECSSTPYCDPGDPNHIYQCGVPIYLCGSLEQCEEQGTGTACVNPCLDTLGNNTSNGCEFYAVEMDVTGEAEGVCYAVFVVNQWKTGEAAKIEVTLNDQVLPVEQFARLPVGTGTGLTYAPYDATAGLPSNQVAILFLSRDPTATSDLNPDDPRALANCPPGVTPAVVGDAALHGTGTSQAFRIRTNVPVVAYQMLPYGGGRARVTGATLLVPTSAWDVNYVVADAYQAPSMINEDRAGPTTVVLASQDGTTVTLNPTADVVGGGNVPPSLAGTPASYVLNHGQYLQFTQPAELTGSVVQADKPVSVIGGATVMDVPLEVARADSAEQMLPPVRALGSEYVAARYRNRGMTEESPPWRMVGVVNGTTLTYDPAQPPGAPSVLSAQELVEFDAPGPFVVRSQDANHPFYFASYMTGGQSFDGDGDPDFVNVVPPAQYLPRYTFFTDPTYPETNLVIIRARDPSTGLLPDVTLDCAGLLGGWQQVDIEDKYEMTRVDLSTGNFQGVGACNNGVHSIEAALAAVPPTDGASPPSPRFGVTVWGWGNDITWPSDMTAADEVNPLFTRWVSYGYPAGANFQPLNSAVITATP